MYRPKYELESFAVVSEEEKALILKARLEALVVANAVYLQGRPPFYRAGG